MAESLLAQQVKVNLKVASYSPGQVWTRQPKKPRAVRTRNTSRLQFQTLSLIPSPSISPSRHLLNSPPREHTNLLNTHTLCASLPSQAFLRLVLHGGLAACPPPSILPLATSAWILSASEYEGQDIYVTQLCDAEAVEIEVAGSPKP